MGETIQDNLLEHQMEKAECLDEVVEAIMQLLKKILVISGEVDIVKDKWKEMPKALKRQVLFRFGSGVLFLLLLLFIIQINRDLYLLLPCLLCMFWLMGSGIGCFGRLQRKIICTCRESVSIWKRRDCERESVLFIWH